MGRKMLKGVVKYRPIFHNNLELQYFQLILIIMQFIHGAWSMACGEGRPGRSKGNLLKNLRTIVILRKNIILNDFLIFISKISFFHCFFLYFSVFKRLGKVSNIFHHAWGVSFFAWSNPSADHQFPSFSHLLYKLSTIFFLKIRKIMEYSSKAF